MKLARLKDKKGRDESSLFIAEGRKLCSEALGNMSVRYAVIDERVKSDERYVSLCTQCGGEIIVMSEGAFSKLSSDSSPDGIIFICDIPDGGCEVQKDERIFAMDGVRDPGNAGTIIRTAAAFGCDRIIVADCADIYSPKVVRASMGAVFKMKFTVCRAFTEIIPPLRAQGRRIISAALSEGALRAGEDRLLASDCIVVGNEGHGVPPATVEMSDSVIYIPMTGKTESLNAASAAAVLLWEHSKVC